MKDKMKKMLLSEIPTFGAFAHTCCISCSSEWYCPTYCDILEKAKKIPFEKIQKSYVRNDGDMQKVFRYIKRYKVTEVKNG